MSRRFPIALAGLTALLTACGSIELRDSVEAQIEAPEAWLADRADAAEPGGGAWWEAFAAPGLSESIQSALAANRDLEVAAARIAGAIAQAEIAGADSLPTVAARIERARAQNVFVGLPFGGGAPASTLATTWTAALSVSWEVDLWGRIAAGQEAAGEALEAARLDARAARESVAARAAQAWLAWIEAAAQLALADRRANSFTETAEIVRIRYEGGLAAALDLRLAEADAARARAEVSARREGLARAHRALDTLLGRPPSAAPEAYPALPEPPAPVPAGLPSELLERRPDLAAAAARLRAADKRADAARAALYPALSLTGTAGRISDTADDLLDPDFDIWSIAGGLTQPIFQGGRLRAAADAEEAAAIEAAAAFEGAFLTALSEVEIALTAETELAEYEERLALAGDAATAAYELALDSYRSGRASLLEVLNAQRVALDTDAALLTARRRRLGARVDLHLALGGGFEDAAL